MTNPRDAGANDQSNSPAVQARWGARSLREERRCFCTRPMLGPSCVTHMIAGRVVEPGRQQLVLVKGSVVEIVSISDNDTFIESVSEDDLYETVVGIGVIEWLSRWDQCSEMEEFRSKDLLVIITESGCVYVTGFDSRHCCLSMLQSFTLSDAAIGYSDYGLSIKADPRLEVLSISARHDYVCFIPFTPNKQEERNSNDEEKEKPNPLEVGVTGTDILDHHQTAEFVLTQELESRLATTENDGGATRLSQYLIMDIAILSMLSNSLDRCTVALLTCAPRSVDQQVIIASISISAKTLTLVKSIQMHHLCTGFAGFIGDSLLPIVGKGVFLLNVRSLEDLGVSHCCSYDQSYQSKNRHAPLENRELVKRRLPAIGSVVSHLNERYLELGKATRESCENSYPFVTCWTEKAAKETQGESKEMADVEKSPSSHVYPVLSCIFEDGSIRDLSFFGDSSFKNALAAWDDMAYSFEQDDAMSESKLNPRGGQRILKTVSLLHSDGMYMLLEDGTLEIYLRKHMMTLRSVPWRKNISPLLLLGSSSNHVNDRQKVLCVTGGCQPSINSIQDGCSVEIIAQSDVNDAELRNEQNSASITGIWAVALTAACEEKAHDLVVLSFVDQTRVLNLQANLEDISEVSKFVQAEATVFSGRLADSIVVQVCPSRVNLVSYSSKSEGLASASSGMIQGRWNYEWQPRDVDHSGSEATISTAIIEDEYLALVTRRRILLLVLRRGATDERPELGCISSFSFDANVEISTMGMFKCDIMSSTWYTPERLAFCVGTYHPSLEIVTFNPETEGFVHCGRRVLNLGESEGLRSSVYLADSIPESIISLQGLLKDEKSRLLFVSLRNGSVIKFRVSLLEHADDDQNVSTTKCDLSFQALINLDMVPIKLAPITIDNRFYAAEGPPRNGRNALPRGIHPAQSAVLAFTNAGEQWILTCQASFDGVINSDDLVKIEKLQIASSFLERHYFADTGLGRNKSADSSRGVTCLCSLKCASPFLHNGLVIATKDKFAIALLKLDSLCEEPLMHLQKPPRRLLNHSDPLRRHEILLAQDSRSEAGCLSLVDLDSQRELVTKNLYKDETAYSLSAFMDRYIVATTGPRRIVPPKVGVDLPNEDLTLHFRTIEMAMSDQDSINSRGRSDEADASHELETQQAEDNCRFLFFNLLRSSDDKNESLYLIEEAKLPGPGLACLCCDNYLLSSAGNYLFVLEMAGAGSLRQIAFSRLRNYIVKIHKLEDVDPSWQEPVECGERVMTFVCVDCFDGPMIYSLIGQYPAEKHESKHRQHFLTYTLRLEWTDPNASYKHLHIDAVPLSWKQESQPSFVKTRSRNALVGIQAECTEVSVLEIPRQTEHPEHNFLETAVARLPEAVTCIVSVPFGQRKIEVTGSKRSATSCNFVVVGTEMGRLVQLAEIQSFLEYEILRRVQCAQVFRVPFLTSFAAHTQQRLLRSRGFLLGVSDSAFPMIDGRVLRQFSVCSRELQQSILEDARAGCLFAVESLIKKLPSRLRTSASMYRQLLADESAKNDLFKEENVVEECIRPVKDGLQLQTVWSLLHKYQLC